MWRGGGKTREVRIEFQGGKTGHHWYRRRWENGTSLISQEVGKRDVTNIAGGGGAEDRRFRLVAPAHCGNTIVNPWLGAVVFGHWSERKEIGNSVREDVRWRGERWQPPNLENQIWRTQRGQAATAWRTSEPRAPKSRRFLQLPSSSGVRKSTHASKILNVSRTENTSKRGKPTIVSWVFHGAEPCIQAPIAWPCPWPSEDRRRADRDWRSNATPPLRLPFAVGWQVAANRWGERKGPSGRGHPLSGTWETWMAPNVMPTK